MVRGKGKQILSISEREGLVSEKKDMEASLQSAEEFGEGTAASGMDKAAIKGQIARIDKALEDGAAPKLRGGTKDDLKKEADELLSQILAGMPTREEMDHPGRNPGAVRKHMLWDSKTAGMRNRYKVIMRMLEPDDPTAADIEKYRKEK